MPKNRRVDHPVILGIVGDSAAGKTTLTEGIAQILGEERVAVICTDDYHRYSRTERGQNGLSALDPLANYIDILEQHIQLLRQWQPILKPVYNHEGGTLDSPEYVEPKPYIILEGLLGYWTRSMRAGYDVKVYLEPTEELRRRWKVQRDTAKRGYTVEQAVWTAARLEKLDVVLFEQPTRRGDHLAMAEVRRRCGIPIMADESVFTAQDAYDVLRQQAADVLSLYPGKHGGIRATQHIAKMAEAVGVPCTIGSNLEREVATAAMAHVTVATANIQCERYPGDLIGPVYYEKPLAREPLCYQADRLWVPEKPGLGVTV